MTNLDNSPMDRKQVKQTTATYTFDNLQLILVTHIRSEKKRKKLYEALLALIAKKEKEARVDALKSINDFMYGRSDTFNKGNPYLIQMETSDVSEEIQERIAALTNDKGAEK